MEIENQEVLDDSPEHTVSPEKDDSRKQLRIQIICCVTNFFSMACVSLQAPFYTKKAEEKGASHSAAGLVFGVYQLTFFFMALVYGSLLSKLGARRISVVSVIVMGVGTVAFSLLDFIQDPNTFLACSIFIRFVQANGNAAYVTSSFAILTNEFPDSVARSISYMETAAGLGILVGPSLGGLLYEAGGFPLPFLVNGLLLLVVGCLTICMMPEVTVRAESTGAKTFQQLILIPGVCLAALSIFVGACAMGFLFPTLEPHLNYNFHLSASAIGGVFVIDGIFYAIFNPVWGWLCDRINARIISLVGSILILVGFSLIGPSSFIPWKPVLWVTCVGCGLYGLGLGATFVSGFAQALKDAKSNGFPDNLSTFGLVSGMWCSVLALGCFFGATLGGILYDYFGFPHASYFLVFLEAIVISTTVFFLPMQSLRRMHTDIV